MQLNRLSLLLAALAISSPGLPARSQTADSFAPQPDNGVGCLALQPDGRVLVAGYFKSLAGVPRQYFGRLNADGTLDLGFTPSLGFRPFFPDDYCLAIQPDGKIITSGYPSNALGPDGLILGRLNSDGTLRDGSSLDIDAAVLGLALQSDGKILVGGDIASIGGEARTNIARLNADWTLDTTFTCWADAVVCCVAQQEDGRILIGGDFKTVNGQTRSGICRLNPDGTLDGSFSASADATVYALAVQADGKILVGGYFTNLNGQSRISIGRLNPDGTLDPAFNSSVVDPASSHVLRCLALQTDGRILVGGLFGTTAGQSPNLCRLNADGTLDTGFHAGVGPSYDEVDSLALQTDGKIVAVGSFSSIGGQPRKFVGRLNNTTPATQNFSFDGSTISWARGGTSPEVWRTTFEFSPEGGGSWAKLGDGTRISGGWQLGGLSLPLNSMVRARGYTASSVVEAMLGAPEIVEQPESRTNSAGTVATFNVYAGGTAPLSYEWQKDAVPLADGANLSGARTSTLVLNNILGADGGGYSVVITNSWGSVTSAVVRLTVIDPVVSVQPVSVIRQIGQDAAFTVGAIGTSPFTYQWRKNGEPLAGASQSSVVITNLQATDAAAYDAVITTIWGSATSHVTLLTINLAPADSFNPAAIGQWGGNVSGLAVQPDGRVLVGGAFYVIVGQAHTNLARLNPDGTLDANFNPAAYGFAGGGPVLLQSDGSIIAGGTSLARLNPDGIPERDFSCGGVDSLLLQPDGKFLAAGYFVLAGNTNIVRFNPDGTLDPTFTAGINGSIPRANRQNPVLTMAKQSDGKLLIGGYYSYDWGVEGDFGYLVRVDAQGRPDTNFNAAAAVNRAFPDHGSHVEAVAVQPDGKILVGGSFSWIGGQNRTGFARLNDDGTADLNFHPDPNGDVSSIALQADGKILVGGWFNIIGGESRSNLARLYPDGTVDPTFNPGADISWFGTTALALQIDGSILVGGSFSTLAGQSRTNLGRLNNNDPATQSLAFDGSALTWLRGGSSPEVWATTFSYSTDGGSSWTDLGPGNRVPGGWQLTGVVAPPRAVFRGRGYLTAGLGNGSSSLVESFVGPPGIYTQPVSITNNAGTTANFYVHAGGPGSTAFQWRKDAKDLVDGVNISGALTDHLTLTSVLRSDSGAYSAVFTYAGGSVTSTVTTLTVIDPAINIQPLDQVTNIDCSVALAPVSAGTPPLYYQWWKDGTPKAGATQQSLLLSNLQVSDAGNYVLAVSNVFGTAISTTAVVTVQAPAVDPLNPGAYGSISSLALQPDGRILAGGDYSTFERLSPDGQLDASFSPTPSGWDSTVDSLTMTSDGKVWTAGSFSSIWSRNRDDLARLNPDGSLDNFNPGYLAGTISALLEQPDGKIIVGGYFFTTAQNIANLARYNPDGSLDATFDAGMHDSYAHVYCLLHQPDGKIFIAGKFTTVAGQARTNLASLNPDGTLDANFNPGLIDGQVTSLGLQADGRLLVASYSTIAAQGRSILSRLNPDGTLDTNFSPVVVGPYSSVQAMALQTDGRILIGGYLNTINGQPWGNLARLNPDGTLDMTFSPQAGGTYLSSVSALAVQPDGRILVGGYFHSLAGQFRNNIGRLQNNEAATQILTFDGSTITWLRGGASPEIWRANFQYSLDGNSWVPIGEGTRIPGGWQLSGVGLPATSTLRARGFIENGSGSWFVESSIPVGAAGRPFILHDASLGFGAAGFGFNIIGASGQVVMIESSENLADWTPMATRTLGSGPQYFSDSTAPASRPRFYRLHLGQ